MNNDEHDADEYVEALTRAEKAGAIGFGMTLTALGFLVLVGISAATGSALDWNEIESFKTVTIVVGITIIPVLITGLYLMGHPAGTGPKRLQEKGNE